MAERLPSIVASNYACETALSKSGDSTAGFANNPPAADTSNLNASPYLINANDDVNPVCPGNVTFPDGIVVPGVEQDTLGTIVVTASTPVSIKTLFPANFKNNCLVTAVASGGFTLSSVGYVNNIPATDVVQGFNNTSIVAIAGNGTAVTTIAYVALTVTGGSDLLLNYVDPGGAATRTFTVSVTKLAGSS